ncbi:MAG: hypothetical protein U9Q70_12200 [Chloroflexota bacterium]|nr:hypothetical protein [Chloroflexota bacterium]
MCAKNKSICSLCKIVAWCVALGGYFGPWISHPAAGLAWNAYDLFDIARLLPAIETGTLTVNLQALRLPLVGLAVWLPFITAPRWRWGAALLGVALAASTLPPYPEIIGSWQTPGWRVPFWWGCGAMLATVLSVLLARREGPWFLLAWTLLTGLPAYVTFLRLLPTLGALYAATVEPGWGFWLCGLGFLLLTSFTWLTAITTETQRLSSQPSGN